MGKGEPLVCDSGIAKISGETNESVTSKTMPSRDNVRHDAPELMEMNCVSATKHSGTYLFAILMLECITEKVPFSHIHRDAMVIHARSNKRECPSRPDGCVRRILIMSRMVMGTDDALLGDQTTTERVLAFLLYQTTRRREGSRIMCNRSSPRERRGASGLPNSPCPRARRRRLFTIWR